MARQYGMTDEQYWHDDPKLLQTYYQVYMQKVHQEAHIYGYYQFVAVSTALSNAFREKGKKPISYLEKPLITAETYTKKQITKENIVQQNRQALRYQNNWLKSLCSNK